MAGKGKISASAPKIPKGETNHVPISQSKKELPGKRSEPDVQDMVKLKEAKERIKTLESSANQIRRQIKDERGGPGETSTFIQIEIDQTRSCWENVQAELIRYKEISRKRKDEIDEWKAWYAKLPATEKETGLKRLQSEIQWRADELSANGVKINELIPKEFEARGAFEMAKIKMKALRAGVLDLPEDEDPRIKGVLAEMEKVSAMINDLEPKKRR